MDEILANIQSLKEEKFPGQDGMQSEFLKLPNDGAMSFLDGIFNIHRGHSYKGVKFSTQKSFQVTD